MTDSTTPITPTTKLPVLHEESRSVSRRSSICSVIIVQEEPFPHSGVEVVGIDMIRQRSSTDPLLPNTPPEFGGDAEGYLENIYSSRDDRDSTDVGGGPDNTPPARAAGAERNGGEREEEGEEEEDGGGRGRTGRRRSSVAEMLPSITLVTVHMLAVGCMYLNS